MRASSQAPTKIWERIPADAGEPFGPYRVHEELGRGGLAIVHRADVVEAAVRHDGPTAVALKRLRPELATDWELVDGFVHEGWLGSQLDHEHVVRTHAAGRIDGTYYIAMELVAGPSLLQVMQQSRSAAGAIPLQVVVALLVQLCEALDYLHGRDPRIVHRDVSPANILISRSGCAKLTDFGVAKTASDRAPTARGVVKGTLAYAAPERLSRDGDRGLPDPLDVRCDLFALGAIAHELLTGRPLFSRQTTAHATIRAVSASPIAPPSRWNPAVPYDLDDIVMTALARDPALRWQNGAAMAFALRAVAREVGALGKDSIRTWLAWAFAKKPRRDTRKLARVLDAIS